MTDDHSRADVRRTFEAIAEHFSATREYAWPEVESFVEDQREVGRALDVGCGNGRHAELLAETADSVVALDASRGLLEAARERLAQVQGSSLVQGDAVSLPLRVDSIDLAVYVATLHHLPTREDRVASLDEIARILRPAGRALVSAWSTAHDRFDRNADAEEGFDTTIDWTLPDGEVVDRFYHVYAPAEFRADVARSDLEIVSFEVSSGNCYAVLESDGDEDYSDAAMA